MWRRKKRTEGQLDYQEMWHSAIENNHTTLGLLQHVEVQRNELRDRQVIVMGMIEAELTTQRSLAVQTNQVKEVIAFLEGLLVAFRPTRLTAAAWEGQEIH